MSLNNLQWRISPYQLQSSEEYSLANIMPKDISSYPGRYTRRLQIGLAQDSCKIIITPATPKDGIGCRMIGSALYQLAVECGSPDNLPTNLYFQAPESQFQLRSLLTLSYFCTSERRRSIYNNYFYAHIPASSQEKAADYEKRVVDAIYCQIADYQKLDTRELQLEKMRSKPDGLFLSRANNELLIIEAKKSKRDFADGTAQIVQYYAQAMNHAHFRNLGVKTCLVTAVNEATEGYKTWQQLMSSMKELRIFVDGSNVTRAAA